MFVDPIQTPYAFNGHVVPGIWRYLLPPEVHRYRLPRERRSTCSDCPQSKFEGYDPVYRCCSYHPSVPNFLLGLALDERAARPAVHRMRRLGGVLPEGFVRSPHQWVDYLADLSDEKFGGANRVKCPNLNPDNGNCNIYAFRNAVCSTFFCHNDHGSAGEKFWEALQELVTQMEFALSQWALARLGFNLKAYFKRLDRLAARIDTVVDPETRGWNERTRRYLWGDRWGRELDVMRACGRLISRNRDRLWEIASDWELLESAAFDKAMNRLVPRKYRHEIDPEDLEEGESLTLAELYADLRKKYRKMWDLPETLRLSPRAKIMKNPRDDDESRFYGERPFLLEFRSRRRGPSVEWREYLTEREVLALREFRRTRRVTDPGLRRSLRKLSDPDNFLIEAVGKKVLESHPSSPR